MSRMTHQYVISAFDDTAPRDQIQAYIKRHFVYSQRVALSVLWHLQHCKLRLFLSYNQLKPVTKTIADDYLLVGNCIIQFILSSIRYCIERFAKGEVTSKVIHGHWLLRYMYLFGLQIAIAISNLLTTIGGERLREGNGDDFPTVKKMGAPRSLPHIFGHHTSSSQHCDERCDFSAKCGGRARPNGVAYCAPHRLLAGFTRQVLEEEKGQEKGKVNEGMGKEGEKKRKKKGRGERKVEPPPQ